MSGFAIRYPFFIIMMCLIIMAVGVTTIGKGRGRIISNMGEYTQRKTRLGEGARTTPVRYRCILLSSATKFGIVLRSKAA